MEQLGENLGSSKSYIYSRIYFLICKNLVFLNFVFRILSFKFIYLILEIIERYLNTYLSYFYMKKVPMALVKNI